MASPDSVTRRRVFVAGTLVAAVVVLAVVGRLVGRRVEPASRPAGTPREQQPPATMEAPTARPDTSRPRAVGPAAAPTSRAERDTRRMVERTLADKLDRELAPADYDRIAGAVVQLRTALATLRTDPGNPAAMADVRDALAEMQGVSGLPPSELAHIFPPDEPAGGSAE
jgi:hypothetical protein